MNRYQIVVGNDTVHDDDDYEDARNAFDSYLTLSKKRYGRVAGEPVTFIDGEEIVDEYTPGEGHLDEEQRRWAEHIVLSVLHDMGRITADKHPLCVHRILRELRDEGFEV
jgi:hypothetical protein